MNRQTTGVVGLMADPGWPTRIAQNISRQLAEELSTQTQSHWETEVTRERLPLDSEGEVPLFQHASHLQKSHNWDYLIYLTDLPLLGSDEIMISKASAEDQAALVSIPSLGVTRTASRVKEIVLALVVASQESFQDAPSAQELHNIMGPKVSSRQSGTEDRHTIRISLTGLRHRLGLLLGTIRSNRPTKLLGALTNSIALGSATGPSVFSMVPSGILPKHYRRYDFSSLVLR